jgi:hypothetical protein
MSRLIRAISMFCMDCLGRALLFGLMGSLLFLPFGIVVCIAQGDPTRLVVITGFGGLVGVLLGVGQVLIDRFSEQPPKPEEPISKKSLLGFYAGSLVPWLQVIELGRAILRKDFGRQKPGRAKRALVAGVGCMIIVGLLMFVVTTVTSAALNESALLALVMAGVGGAIAGALTDSR